MFSRYKFHFYPQKSNNKKLNYNCVCFSPASLRCSGTDTQCISMRSKWTIIISIFQFIIFLLKQVWEAISRQSQYVCVTIPWSYKNSTFISFFHPRESLNNWNLAVSHHQFLSDKSLEGSQPLDQHSLSFIHMRKKTPAMKYCITGQTWFKLFNLDPSSVLWVILKFGHKEACNLAVISDTVQYRSFNAWGDAVQLRLTTVPKQFCCISNADVVSASLQTLNLDLSC